MYSLSCLSPRGVLDHNLKALTLFSTTCRISPEVDFGTVVRASPVAGFLTSIQSSELDCLVISIEKGERETIIHTLRTSLSTKFPITPTMPSISSVIPWLKVKLSHFV
jgi:hypothetical protein